MSRHAVEVRECDGNEYWGSRYREYEKTPTADKTAKSLSAAIGNVESFWLTPSALYNLMSRIGFTSMYELKSPSVNYENLDRHTILALKGAAERLLSSGTIESIGRKHWPPRFIDEEATHIELGRCR
jgi:hypothetical protein